MKIVIDTNVVISGVFFGGYPQTVLRCVVQGRVTASATAEIIDEYLEIAQEMVRRKQGHIRKDILSPLIDKLELIEPQSDIHVSRDPDDDKFIACANDAKALYIVSGDKDLLVLERYKNIEIVTAKEFCERYLNMCIS